MTPAGAALLAGAGLAAGAINALAGGGSLISFPALLAVGYQPVQASVTNTVALIPGYTASAASSRPELVGQRGLLRSLAPTSVAGAIVGAVLLLTTPGDLFRSVVPFLILLACALLALQPRLAALVQRRPSTAGSERRSPTLQAGVFLAGVYGAYFGAGLGVMLLGVLGILLPERLLRLNAAKNVLSLLINVVALVAFALFGPVAWSAVLVIGMTSSAGGYVGVKVARRVPAPALRVAVVLYGVTVALVLLVRN